MGFMRIRRVRTHQIAAWADVLRHVEDESPACVIFDVEPLVSYWRNGSADLESGVARVLDEMAGLAGVRMVAFSTNSGRRPAAALTREGLDIRYVSDARKPFRSREYRDFPRPGMLVGDQMATDGLLAWRLGYTFLHYRPAPATIPPRSRAMGYVGRPFRFLFSAIAPGEGGRP
jgi:predicted HAD superfamily phosphohydrolase YqeG